MARLVSGVVNAARDRHAAFDRVRTPDGVLYRFLADYCQEVQGKIMAIDPTYAGVEVTLSFALPLADFDAGMALGPGRIVTDIVAVEPLSAGVDRDTIPIQLISRDQRFARNGPIAAAWQEGENLYLRGPYTRWRDMGSIEVQVVQSFTDADVTALQAKTAVLPLPDAGAKMATEAMAYLMARRGHNDPQLPPIDVGLFRDELSRSEEAFYDAIRQRDVGRVFFTADVWP